MTLLAEGTTMPEGFTSGMDAQPELGRDILSAGHHREGVSVYLITAEEYARYRALYGNHVFHWRYATEDESREAARLRWEHLAQTSAG